MGSFASLLIKMLLPRVVDIGVELVMHVLNDRVSDDKSRWSREMYEIASAEKDELKQQALSAARDTGIYKKIAKLSK
jgi:hypothetical protein